MIGPAVVAQAYLPLLERGAKKTIVNVTSGLASIGLDIGDKCATYSMSKTMLNMLVSTLYPAKLMSIDLLSDIQAEGRTTRHHYRARRPRVGKDW